MNLPDIHIPHPAEAMLLARIPADVRERAARVRLMVFDVDGVLTDGVLWYSPQGEAMKGFHVLDGHGLKLLRESGIEVALMTGRESTMVSRRAADLGIAEVLQGVSDKGAALQALAGRMNVTLDEIGFMGDDLMDLPALQRVGFAVSVPGAPAYVAHAAHWVTGKPGGHGAAREVCDLILAAQGRLGNFIASGSRGLLTAGSAQ
jgi:3-deoxy-D-manno-octulosonate 8-phosphate phosphatase (KDO 8-P phosphatase)